MSSNNPENQTNDAGVNADHTLPNPNPGPEVGTQPQPDTRAHLVAFFAEYPEFTYESTRPALSELKRMMRQFQWDMKSLEGSFAQQGFRRALVLQFNLTYGTDQNDLASWQNLCRAMRVTNIPDKLSKCKKLVDSIFVNLVDLVDMPNTGRPARLFETEAALSKYSKSRKKIFPRGDAHAGGLLKHLLRQIVQPRRLRKTKAKTS